MPSSPRAARRDRKVHGERGFTLVETLVSVSLLTLVGGGATTGIVAGLRAQSDNQNRTVATNLVRADIDTARAVAYPAYPDPAARTAKLVGGRTFFLVRTVTATGGSGVATCPDTITATGVLSLTVTSTVTWNNDRGVVTMSTVISC